MSKFDKELDELFRDAARSTAGKPGEDILRAGIMLGQGAYRKHCTEKPKAPKVHRHLRLVKGGEDVHTD